MENLESHDILPYHFPGMENHGIWVWVMESHEKWLKIIFPRTKKKNTLNEWSFSHYFENILSILSQGKHKKNPGKGHGIL